MATASIRRLFASNDITRTAFATAPSPAHLPFHLQQTKSTTAPIRRSTDRDRRRHINLVSRSPTERPTTFRLDRHRPLFPGGIDTNRSCRQCRGPPHAMCPQRVRSATSPLSPRGVRAGGPVRPRSADPPYPRLRPQEDDNTPIYGVPYFRTISTTAPAQPYDIDFSVYRTSRAVSPPRPADREPAPRFHERLSGPQPDPWHGRALTAASAPQGLSPLGHRAATGLGRPAAPPRVADWRPLLHPSVPTSSSRPCNATSTTQTASLDRGQEGSLATFGRRFLADLADTGRAPGWLAIRTLRLPRRCRYAASRSERSCWPVNGSDRLSRPRPTQGLLSFDTLDRGGRFGSTAASA